MKKSEQGFVLPLTLLFTLLLCLFVMFQIDYYGTEKRFLREQEEIFTLESLLQMATYDLFQQLSESPSNQGTFYYEKGHASYWLLNSQDATVNIQLTVETAHQGKRTIYILYDTEEEIVKSWREVR